MPWTFSWGFKLFLLLMLTSFRYWAEATIVGILASVGFSRVYITTESAHRPLQTFQSALPTAQAKQNFYTMTSSKIVSVTADFLK